MNNKFEYGALILRVVLGITFFIHGLVKFQDGIGNTVGWFESIGLPGMLAYAVGILEWVGGLALIVGLVTRIVSTFFALLMVGAIFKVKFALGFIAGYELDLAFLAMSVVLAITGSKMFALDQVIFNNGTKKNENSKVS